MGDDHQEEIEKLNAGFQEYEADYTDLERSNGFEVYITSHSALRACICNTTLLIV
jgi:hypothetical protein